MSLSLKPSVTLSTPSVYEPFPIPQKEDESIWQEYLKKSSDRIEGEYPTEARIIFLGDLHNQKWQNAWRRAIMEHYSSNKLEKDIILCEAYEAFKKLPYIPASIQPRDGSFFKMNFYGWENIELYNSSVSAMTKAVTIYERYNTPPSITTWSEEDVMSFTTLKEQVFQEGVQRNTSLIVTTTAVYKTLQPGQKLFVIAGSNHLFLKKDETSSREHNILDFFSDTKACLILPKQTEPLALTECMQYYAEMMPRTKPLVLTTENIVLKKPKKLKPKRRQASKSTGFQFLISDSSVVSSQEITKKSKVHMSDVSKATSASQSNKKKRKQLSSALVPSKISR